MPSTALKNKKELQSLVCGLSLLSTGGGGVAQFGLGCLQRAMDEGCTVAWKDISELDNDDWTLTVAGLGGKPPKELPTDKELAAMGGDENSLLDRVPPEARCEAIKHLSNYADVDIKGMVSLELGPANTSVSLVSSLKLGIPPIDGDYAGRALPEVNQFTPALHGYPCCPAALVDQWGNSIIVKEVNTNAAFDRIARLQCEASYGPIAAALYLLQVKDVKKILVPETLSLCLQLGKLITQSVQSGSNPIKTILESDQVECYTLFKGEVVENKREDKEGYKFWYGSIKIKGINSFSGHTFRVWYKNEYHIGWLDNEPLIMSPDIIAVLDPKTGWARPSDEVEAGQRVTVLGLKTLYPDYRTQKGLQLLGPQHFGFDHAYIPIEEAAEKKDKK